MKKASKPKGNPKMKQAITLAKEIRKPKEKWTDAVKRAYAQLNK
jgi:transcriptional/translational regulatory protein YebC/TACO1